MIRRPPRSTQGVSSAASDVYKRQIHKIIRVRQKRRQSASASLLNGSPVEFHHHFCQLSDTCQPQTLLLTFLLPKDRTGDGCSSCMHVFTPDPLTHAKLTPSFHRTGPQRSKFVHSPTPTSYPSSSFQVKGRRSAVLRLLDTCNHTGRAARSWTLGSSS